MLSNFPSDIILNIIYFLPNIHIINTLTQANNYMYNTIDNSFYIHWSYKFYSNDFWDRARKRTTSISRPLKSMKHELMRIDKFNNSLKTINTVWTNKDYYKYWDILEAAYININLKNNISIQP